MSALLPKARAKIEKELRAAYSFAKLQSEQSALNYLKHVLIDSRPEPMLFRECAEPWQWALAARVTPALEHTMGTRLTYQGPRRFWLGMPRGHDKSSFIGRLSSWCLAFGQRPRRMVVAAGDKEQAGFVAEFMKAEAALNPWVNSRLRFKYWQVDGESGSRLRIIAADASTSWGLNEDVYILDEVTHWEKRELYDSVITAADKNPASVVLIISNAGVLTTWQHEQLLACKRSPYWYVYEAPGRIANWMSEGQIGETRKTLPLPLARRLYDNVWIDPGEECGFVTRSEAQSCVDGGLSKRDRGHKSLRPYYCGIDYGPVRDRTVCCVVHREPGPDKRIVLDHMSVWQGSPDRRVPVDEVEQWMRDAERHFHHPVFVVDPHNLEGTLQKFEGYHDVRRFEARGGKGNHQLAANLRSLVINGQVKFYPQAGELLKDGRPEDLVSELAEVLLKPMSYGFRIDNAVTRHDDRVVALGMACLELVKDEGLIRMPVKMGRWF